MESSTDVFVFLTLYFGMLAVFLVPFYVLYCLPLGKLFDRAGEAQWKAWVPFVNSYTRTKIVFGEDKAWWFLIDFILGGLFGLYLAYNEAKAFGQEPLVCILHVFFQPITTFMIWLQKAPYCGTQRFILD